MSDDGCSSGGSELNERGNDQHVDETTLDETFDLLSNHRRRAILVTLRNTTDEVASVTDLVNHLGERSSKTTNSDRLRISLTNKHLPKLTAASVIDFDPRSEMVRYRGNELVENTLDLISDQKE